MKLNDFQLSTRITVGMLLLIVVVALMWIFTENRRLYDAYLKERSADLEAALNVEKVRLTQSIETLRQDTLFLANIPPVAGMVRAAANHGIDPRDKNPYSMWETRLQETFVAFLRAHPDYFKVRYIGVANGGRELVRVDNHNGRIEVTSHAALQSKGSRDFFKAGLSLTRERIYLSEFNLNQDWGKIEEPHRPTLRAVTPVFDANGQIFGVIVINQDVRPVFDSAGLGLPPGVQTYITDQQGRYLSHPDTKRAFSFETGGNDKISDDFPIVKPMFEAQSQNYLPLHIEDGPSGVDYLAAERLFFDASDPTRFLLLAHRLPGEMVAKQAVGFLLPNIYETLIVVIILSGVFMLVLRHIFAPLKHITIAARDIAAGNRYLRLKTGGGGELGELSDALNIMIEKLLDSDLLEGENAFRKELIESLPGVFYMINARGRYVMWNRNLEQVLQRTDKEIAFSNPLDFFEGEDKVNIENAIRRVFTEGQVEVEATMVAKNRTRMPYHFTGRRVEHGGEPILIGLGLDISEQRENLHKTQSLLRRNQALMQSSMEGIHILDIKGNVLDVNNAFCNMLGYSREEAMRLNVRDWDDQVPAEEISSRFRHFIGKSEIFETTHRRKDGTQLNVEVCANGVEIDGETFLFASSRDITERKRTDEEIRELAFYDPLTRLPNRRYFQERFQAALLASNRYDDHGAILFIDLDHFKLLNDTMGHEYGDLLLVEVASRIKSCVREMDTVARMGGDEFVVLLESISGERADVAKKAWLVAQKIRETLIQSYRIKDYEYAISPSIGISLYHGDAENMDELLDHADTAMYQAKNAGRNSVRFYDTNLQLELDIKPAE